jgi:hypothetical protein
MIANKERKTQEDVSAEEYQNLLELAVENH